MTDFDEITSADGTRLALRRVGSGRPLLMLHGSGGGLDSWAAVADRLADAYEVWLVARRGYGPSGVPEQPNTFATEVADVRAVVTTATDATGHDVDLVGASYGAILALHAARTAVAGIRSLILWEPPLFATGISPAVLEEYRGLCAAGDFSGANAVLMEKVARVPEPLLTQLVAAGGNEDGGETRRAATGWTHDLEALVEDRRDIERWSRVDLPVLLLQGAQTWDPMPATMDSLARQLPNVTRVAYADQLHFAPSVAPDLLASSIRTFLTSLDEPTAPTPLPRR